MRLKDWIETLEALPKGAVVVFDTGENVGPLISWRGIYAQLTLPTAREPWTVKELLKDAKGAVGSVFTGYKGGDYVMDESTPVWADDYGRCTYRVPTGVADKAGMAVVMTEVIRDEYWSRFHQERRNTEAELEETVEDDDTIPPPSPHRQDATSEAVERLLKLHGFGTAPDGLQGPSKTRRPFPRDTRGAA